MLARFGYFSLLGCALVADVGTEHTYAEAMIDFILEVVLSNDEGTITHTMLLLELNS